MSTKISFTKRSAAIQTRFGKVLPHLAKTRQLIAFDQQGHGRTAGIAERPFSFEQSADDAVALLGNSLTETNHDWRPRQERKIEAYE
jgi:hypothetical protein